jgi:uncharacterized protein
MRATFCPAEVSLDSKLHTRQQGMESAYHVFSVAGEDYVVNPHTMRFAKVDAGTAEALRSGREDLPEITARIGPPRPITQSKEPEWRFAPPDKIVLMLTYACNMACRYCYQGGIPDVRETDMPEEVARRAIDWLIEQSGSAPEIGIGWFGGEPLMKFAMIRKTAAYAEEKAASAGKRVRFGTMTNGLPLTEEVIEFLAGKQAEVTVSFDGPPEVQNANRPLKNGAPSYSVIAPRLKALTKRYPGAAMRVTLLPGADIDAVFAAARELGFRNCRVGKVLSSIMPGGTKSDEAAATDDFLAYLARQAGRLVEAVRARDAAQLAEIAVDAVLVEAVRRAAGANSPFFDGRRQFFSCGAGRQFLTVSVRGDIYPCPRFVACPEHKIGSIYETTLHNEIHKKSLLFNADECPHCWARHYCGGGCVSQHLGATGSIFKVNSETCRWRKGRFEQAIRIMASLDEGDRRFLAECGLFRHW